MVTPTFAARTDQVVAQIQLLLELPSPTPPTHVDPDPNPDLVDQPGARGASIRTSSAGHSPTSNLEYTFRGLFEALSMSAVSNQALLDRLDRTVRIEAALRVVLARLLPNRPHTMPSALRRVNEEVESLGDALKQAREEREAEMGLQEKVEQERDQANTERDQLEERVRELQTELRTCGLLCSCSDPAARVQAAQPQEVVALLGKVRGLRTRLREAQDEAKKYKELATRVENTIQAQLSSMADQVRELDRQQRSHEEEVAEFEERYRVEVAGHREASRALATTTQRFPDVFPAFWDWVSAHFRVTSGPVFDRLLEAWVRDDPALFEDNCENLSVFAFPTRQTPSTRARGRIRGVSYDNWSAVLARGQRSQSLAVPILPTPTSHSGAVSYPGSPGPTRTMTLVTGASSGAADALVSTKSGSSMTPGTTGTESADAASSLSSTSGASEGASGAVQTTRTSGMASPGPGSTSSSVPTNLPAAQVSTPSSKRPSPELDRALRSFWQKYAHSIWNRSFMTSSGAAEREVVALMRPLLGIAGSLFRVVQAYGVQLLRFLCYPHSYWPEFLRDGVSLRNLITLHGGQAVADYVQTQGPE
ncbi:hypothetical protein DYB28_005848 [Aphanomyces astaci]|uniref:Uncharacterized protein n=1 Tax=Aphanomyces astaci TaxID=112090 RepID=A0A9X8HBR3_APHAT|nr:hypothetical protein DYB28_005848 [Aphanomyces astaci]